MHNEIYANGTVLALQAFGVTKTAADSVYNEMARIGPSYLIDPADASIPRDLRRQLYEHNLQQAALQRPGSVVGTGLTGALRGGLSLAPAGALAGALFPPMGSRLQGALLGAAGAAAGGASFDGLRSAYHQYRANKDIHDAQMRLLRGDVDAQFDALESKGEGVSPELDYEHAPQGLQAELFKHELGQMAEAPPLPTAKIMGAMGALGAIPGALLSPGNRIQGAGMGALGGALLGGGLSHSYNKDLAQAKRMVGAAKKDAKKSEKKQEKKAAVFGASEPDGLEYDSIPYEHRRAAYESYLNAKAKEAPTPYGKAIGVGALVGGIPFGLLGAAMPGAGGSRLTNALGLGAVGALTGGLTGAGMAASDRSAISHAQKTLQNGAVDSALARAITQSLQEKEDREESRHQEMLEEMRRNSRGSGGGGGYGGSYGFESRRGRESAAPAAPARDSVTCPWCRTYHADRPGVNCTTCGGPLGMGKASSYTPFGHR